MGCFLAGRLSLVLSLGCCEQPTKDRAKKPRKARFEEGRAEVIAAPSGNSSATGTKEASQSPNPAVPSSTGPVPSLPDTSSGLASSSPGDSQSGMESPVKTNPPNGTGRVADRWKEPTLIGFKPAPSSLATNRAAPGTRVVGAAGSGMAGRRPLPGLVNPAAAAVVDKDKEQRAAVPSSPTRHTRIPSTGNRALVMEVAQAMNEAAEQQGNEKEEKESPSAPLSAREVPSTGHGGPVGEKRKSSYERYSAIAMPSLAEERTPAASPANTTSRSGGQNVLGAKVTSESPLSSLRVESASAVGQSPKAPSPKVYIGEDRFL